MTVFVDPLQIGSRVRCSLPHAGEGIIFAVHGEQSPETVKSLGGVGVTGGRAKVDVVFKAGGISLQLPESLVRASVQWRVLDGVADAAEIAAAIEHAEQTQAKAKAAEDDAAARKAAEIERLKTAPEFAHLEQGDDCYSGTLAAKNIRRILKAAFPGVKFSVRKQSYGSLVIEWVDGPTENDIQGAVGQFKAGRFDGQDDSYKYDNAPWSSVFGAANYISVRRRHSAALIERAISAVFNEYPGNLAGIERPTVEQYESGSLHIVCVPGLVDSLQRVISLALYGSRG